MSRGILEVRVVARDGVEGFQDIAREQTLRVLLGFVGHEAVDEGPGCRARDDAGEGGVEEVGVVVDGVLEAGVAVFGEAGAGDGVAVLLAELVEGFELRDLDEVVVAAENVSQPCALFDGLI